ncbi:hypothetical protein AB0F18_27650 [Streptomyces sp. NPDC029216]|uniref:hypothetical protein n=1 Tax=Streptomyces sp. NPDC029216 TaxID=3154701 RepID=UPI0033D29365
MSHNAGWAQHHPGQPVPPWGGWAPPAPQPGVIPLRPLGTGEVLGGAFSAFRRYWKPMTGIILAVQGLGLLLVVAAIGVAALGAHDRFAAVFDRPKGDPPAADDVAALLLYFAPVAVLALVTLTLCTGMLTALCPAVIQEAVLGRPTTFAALWRRCWSRLPSVLGVVLCVGLFTAGPVLALYAVCFPLMIMPGDRPGPSPVVLLVTVMGVLLWMPVAVWLAVRFSLAPAVAVCEGLGPVAAMRRSARLVGGGWWRTFGITALGYLLATVVGYVVQLPFVLIGVFALVPTIMGAGDGGDPAALVLGFGVYLASILLGTAVSAVFQVGYPQLVLSLLYVDQRIRKENLAEALVASAAAPAPGRPAGPGPAGA